MFAMAMAGGLVGGVVALRLDAAPTPAPAPAVVVPTAPASAEDRLREALPSIFPAVVAVLAELPPQTADDGRVFQTENLGSGIVLSDSGYVLTNYHVVDGAATISVILSTGEERPATLLADDSPFTDVAILQTAPGGLRTARLGDSATLHPGDPVAAISSGLVTYENQVKIGIVSATGVPFPRNGVILEDMVQTDAAVNHGDSGGALVNARGEVVGLITTVVRTNPQGQTVEGVALAHSSNSIRPVVEAVLGGEGNPRPRTGIERLGYHLMIDGGVAQSLGLSVQRGAVILNVEPGSPAEDAGVRRGDIVTAVNGLAVAPDAPFVNLLGAAPTGVVVLTVLRDGRERLIRVTPRPVIPTRRPAG